MGISGLEKLVKPCEVAPEPSKEVKNAFLAH